MTNQYTVSLHSLSHYNSGSLVTESFDLIDYENIEDFYKAVHEWLEPLNSDEWILCDCDSAIKSWCHEYSIDKEVFDIIHNTDIELDVASAYISLFGSWDEDRCQESYTGSFMYETDVNEYLVELFLECTEVPEALLGYLDEDKIVRDMMFDYSFSDNHLFRSC